MTGRICCYQGGCHREGIRPWFLHLEKYLREHDLTMQELTEDHAAAALDSWHKERRTPGA